MLKVYYGRQSIDINNFIFKSIAKELEVISENQGFAEECKKVILLVPDQYTLQAERDAFDYLRVKGLIDLEILSFSRLQTRVFAEVGGGRGTYVDKYGRHMLLAKILAEYKGELEVFLGMESKSLFIDMLNNLISEMKQFNKNPSELREITEQMENSILKRKLQDVLKIYSAYEAYISAENYTDSEDRLKDFTKKISRSQFVKDCQIWVSGFDYFTPKSLEIICELMEYSVDLNVILTCEEDAKDNENQLFSLTREMKNKFTREAYRRGIPFVEEEITSDFEETNRPKELIHLEQEIFVTPPRKWEVKENPKAIKLVKAANFYGEAETAAAYVLGLVRDEGLKYKDIAIICNDLDSRGSIIKRVFEEYGMRVFLDKKRSILHNPVAKFVINILDLASGTRQIRDILGLIKTGLTDIDYESVEEFEIYCKKYKIKAFMLGKPFKKGYNEYGEEGMKGLDRIREKIWELLCSFEKTFKEANTVEEKIRSLYRFMDEEVELPRRIAANIEALETSGKIELAYEAAQIWNIIIGIFDQMTALTGKEILIAKDIQTILKSGFEAVEIGLLPPTADELVVGTMQRTRLSAIKVLLIIGANDGVLPAGVSSEGILSEDEKLILFNENKELCKPEKIMAQEEKLAIYKNLAKATESVWISCAASDSEGKTQLPSIIFNQIAEMFPCIEIEKDILNQERAMALIESEGSAFKHLTEALRGALEQGTLESEWKETINWYGLNRPEKKISLSKGLFFRIGNDNQEKEIMNQLYNGGGMKPLKVSPSRLERYSRCPFSHFVDYGLRPKDIRVFEVAGREIGDIYHNCIMRLSEKLTIRGIELNEEGSPWKTITYEKCESLVGEYIEYEAEIYKEGILNLGKEEAYRKERMKKICTDAAWVLIGHVRQGHIVRVDFEAEFGKDEGKAFEPIEVGGVVIEGKIDRVDLLKNGSTKIIDYKSGNEKFNLNEVKGGWRLQLMLYLKAALRPKGEQACEAGGVFYFRIEEPMINASAIGKTDLADKINKELEKTFKLDGIMVDDPETIESIVGDFEAYSPIAQVKKTKEGIKGTSEGKLLSRDEFSELQQEVDKKIKELAEGLAKGNIAVAPKKSGNISGCTYCLYRSICGFDTAFSECKFEVIS